MKTRMSNRALIDKMVAEHGNNRELYHSMKRYYDGKHDIFTFYQKFPNRANTIVVDNFVNKFINEEVQYSLGNPLSYVSLSGDKAIIDAIYYNTFHWKDNHNQELMRVLEIYGTAYALNYIDNRGRFCERILTPAEAICYCDDNGVPQRFIHFYQKQYEEHFYKDIYYPDGKIEVYRGNTKIATRNQTFKGIPVTVCKLENIEDTIYAKIKQLQDAYNQILSDQCNTISDYRNAYLVVSGVAVDEDTEKKLHTHGIMSLPSANANARWLVKDMPDTYIQNMLDNLKNSMYSSTNHIDGNEKLQSNTSGTALRNRLVFLEQRCNMMLQIVLDTVYERLARLFEYLSVKGQNYSITDIKVVSSPCIPQDEVSIAQMLSQLGIGTNISLDTALSLLPFIENPAHEIAKIRAEQDEKQKREYAINLQMIEGDE